jgi:hypothetical protein
LKKWQSNVMRARKNSIIIWILLWVAISGQHAYAVSDLSIQDAGNLTFGMVTKTQGQDVEAVVSGATSGRGQVTIKGSDDIAHTVRITFESCGLNGNQVKIGDFTASYGGKSWNVMGDGPLTQTGLAAPGIAGTTLQYGATALVKSDAALGMTSPCYDITIAYDCAFDAVPCASNSPMTTNRVADITILGFPISMTELQAMDFGRIIKPSANSNVTLQPSGIMLVTSGDATILETGNAASFEFVAEANTSISVNAGFTSSDDPGLSLTSLKGVMNGGAETTLAAQSFTTSAVSSTNTLTIGATLVMDASLVSPGQKALKYQISINYE